MDFKTQQNLRLMRNIQSGFFQHPTLLPQNWKLLKVLPGRITTMAE